LDPRQLFVDERLLGRCAYCGGIPETRDHVPPKVFLDEPYPEELPVVGACLECNNGASADEQYLACFLDCVIAGSTCPSEKHREKIRRTLEQIPALRALIESARRAAPNGDLLWDLDTPRVKDVICKLARSHVAYEFSETRTENPEHVWCSPLNVMSEEERQSFEEISPLQPLPEIGNRAFIRVCHVMGNSAVSDGWQVVQENRYRYYADPGSSAVRIVLSEYLACEVAW
jgi:hypothetical protein